MYTKPLIPFALLALSATAFFWLGPIGLALSFALTLSTFNPLTMLTYFSGVARGIACCFDILLNVIGGPLLNKICVDQTGSYYRFGQVEYLSTALGENQHRATLSRFGRVIVALLNALEPSHCLLSAGYPAADIVVSKRLTLLYQVAVIVFSLTLLYLTLTAWHVFNS